MCNDKVILLRDHSHNSERAEKLLIRKKVEHMCIFSTLHKADLPLIIHNHAVYSGLHAIINYLRGV